MTTDRSEQSGPVEKLREVMDQLDAYREHSRDGGDEACSDHPDAPHGFDRNGSHSMDRYVCDCEGWEPYPWESEELARGAAFFLSEHGRELLALLSSHQQAVEALTKRAESAEARLARVAAVLADLRGRLTPAADFLADQIAAAIAPQEG